MHLHGLHHVTAVTAGISANYRFYTSVLGMRLVKRSVNQDDVSAYHLFYADGIGSPGTDLTFFDWAVPRERRGTNSICRTGLRVNGEASLAWWEDRFREHRMSVEPIHQRDGRLALDFEDPEGQRLTLVDDGETGDPPVPWAAGPVPVEHQVRGLGPIYLSVPRLPPTEMVLLRVMGMEKSRDYAWNGRSCHVYGMPAAGEGPHSEVHVLVEPDQPPVQPGAGGVHHVAYRIPDADHFGWAERLNELGVRNSGPVDRYYFRSLYFREPNGILFELATDGPGFAVDEDPATLGEEIALPPFLEPHRQRIVANLKPIG